MTDTHLGHTHPAHTKGCLVRSERSRPARGVVAREKAVQLAPGEPHRVPFLENPPLAGTWPPVLKAPTQDPVPQNRWDWDTAAPRAAQGQMLTPIQNLKIHPKEITLVGSDQ